MRFNTIGKLTALAGVALLGASSIASAATVSCPGALGGDLNRQITVSGALANGECYYQEGNLKVSNNQDDFATWLGTGYTEIEKDVAPGGNADGDLIYTFNQGRTAGTWTMTSDFWKDYAEIFIAFHFGNANDRSPDSFIVELNPTTLTGDWAFTPVNLANGLSNLYLIGRGTPSSSSSSSSSGGSSSSGETSSSSGTQVPEPGSLTLLGLGLLGLGAAARRRNAKK